VGKGQLLPAVAKAGDVPTLRLYTYRTEERTPGFVSASLKLNSYQLRTALGWLLQASGIMINARGSFLVVVADRQVGELATHIMVSHRITVTRVTSVLMFLLQYLHISLTVVG
jgi:hypothetical protein